MHRVVAKDSEETLEKESGRLKRNWTGIFHVLCSISAFSLTCWCIYKYMKDKDVSLVNYNRFNSDKNRLCTQLDVKNLLGNNNILLCFLVFTLCRKFYWYTADFGFTRVMETMEIHQKSIPVQSKASKIYGSHRIS